MKVVTLKQEVICNSLTSHTKQMHYENLRSQIRLNVQYLFTHFLQHEMERQEKLIKNVVDLHAISSKMLLELQNAKKSICLP